MPPLTFNAAQEWLKSRVNVPTGLSSAELALAPDFPGQVKAHAFFSAKVTSANVLDALRREVDRYVGGDVDIGTARLALKSFLSRQGVAPDDVGATEGPAEGMDPDEWKARKKITNLASTRRLDLILRQNAGMAHALGNREVSMHPHIKERWPYYRYDARGDARPTHAALDDLVLPKDDPFWHTHTPPWEFNCRCDIDDADEAEAEQYGEGKAVVTEHPDGSQSGTLVTGAGQTVNFSPPPSGFVFRADAAFTEPNWDAIAEGPLRKRVQLGYTKFKSAVHGEHAGA